MVGFGQMKKSKLVKELARENGRNAVDCAAQLDIAVNRIIRTLRSGKPAHLPGLGTINPGKQWTFKQEQHDS
jgi:nucleoid DNA-binding protein